MALPARVIELWEQAGGSSVPDLEIFTTTEGLETFLTKIAEEAARAGIKLAHNTMHHSIQTLLTEKPDGN